MKPNQLSKRELITESTDKGGSVLEFFDLFFKKLGTYERRKRE